MFGVLKRGGKVFLLKLWPDTKASTLRHIVAEKLAPDSMVYTDCCRRYNALDVSAFYHERINHSRLFATGKNHINGVDNFWSQTKRVLQKYNGIIQKTVSCFSKSARSDLTTAAQKVSLKYLNLGLEFKPIYYTPYIFRNLAYAFP